MKKLYLAVTPDKYELPLYVADTARELADWAGVSINNVLSYISHGRTGTTNKVKFLRIEYDENDSD